VVKLDLHQAIVDAIQDSDGLRAMAASQTLLATPAR
jgi:DNA-binding FadR family transcriptional regulator